MGLKRSQVHLAGLLLVVGLAQAQLDRPGPPYPDAHHNNAIHQESSANQWRNQGGGRYPPRNQERLPSLSPNILKTLYRALGPGVPVESPTESAFRNQNNFHSYYLQSPHQPEHNVEKQPYQEPPPQRYNAVEQSGVQTAHVYIPYSNKDYTQRPMPNVLVKYHAQGKTHENYVQQYSQPDPVVQVPQYPQSDPNTAMVQAVQVHQYSHTQPEIQQQQYSQHQPIVQQYPSVVQQQQKAPLVKQESQTASPSHFAINFQLPPKKHRSKKRPHHHHVKSYTYKIKSKGKHIQVSNGKNVFRKKK